MRLDLSDDELVLLDGLCRPEIQTEVEAAKARLAAVTTHSDLDPRHARLLADVMSEATKNGALRWVSTRADHCSLCDDKPYGYVKYKSGPNRGLKNLKKPFSYAAVEMGRSHVIGYVKLGGCNDCMTSLKPHLVEAVSGLRCQVPPPLDTPDRPRWRRYDNRVCTKCGWTGHEGQMGRDRTVMGDGWVPSFCPVCGAGGVSLFGPRIVESASGFTAELETEYVTERRFDKHGSWPAIATTEDASS